MPVPFGIFLKNGPMRACVGKTKYFRDNRYHNHADIGLRRFSSLVKRKRCCRWVGIPSTQIAFFFAATRPKTRTSFRLKNRYYTNPLQKAGSKTLIQSRNIDLYINNPFVMTGTMWVSK